MIFTPFLTFPTHVCKTRAGVSRRAVRFRPDFLGHIFFREGFLAKSGGVFDAASH